METLILTLVGPTRAVVPRRVGVEVRPGDGALRLPEAPPLDAAWRASARNAWDAALALTGARGVDAAVRVAGPGPLAGGSAGLPLGLLFAAALQGRPLPPHFATGAVAGPDGRLAGGASAVEKARGATDLAPQLGMAAGWRFLAPLGAPGAEGITRVPDLAAACRALGLH